MGTIGDLEPRAERQKHAHEPLTAVEKRRVLAILIVAFFVVFFWAAFEQAGSSMNIFALENTRRTLAGWEIPASWFQSINSALILVGGPLMAWLWERLGKRKQEPSTPTKMAFGLLFLAAGFAVLTFGALGARDGNLVSPLWLVAAYSLHTVGELCLSPVGLSLVTKLAPARLASLLMGTWFLANFAANLVGGYLAGAMESIKSGVYFHVFGGLADFYLIFVATSAAAGVLLLLLSPFLNGLIGADAAAQELPGKSAGAIKLAQT
jgi:POT family proton-dependent oligopeptide transporter